MKICNAYFWVKKIKKSPFFRQIKSFSNKIDKALSPKEVSRHFSGGFYFCFFSFVLLLIISSSSQGLAKGNGLNGNTAGVVNAFFQDDKNLNSDSLFFSQSKQLALETPDLKIIQNGFVYGISTPRILTTQTLGDLFGESSQNRKEITEYTVEPGDTMASVAQRFEVSTTTIALANSISTNSALKTGQVLVILPVDGLLHVVRSGDTVGDIAKKYKAKSDDIISINNLSNEADIFIGDILIVPGGVTPAKPAPSAPQTVVPDSFFIFPAEGKITQGLHYYNAVDTANQCGTSVHAAAGGLVQKVRYDYRYGNYITILHSNGVVTYYGHLQTMFVKPGDRVEIGDRIASMGRTGTAATGCHVHFQVVGSANPLAKYLLGTNLKYK